MRWALYLLAFAFLGVFLILPVATAVGAGAELAYYREIILNPVYRDGLLNALGIATGTTLLAFTIALPLAWLTARHRFPLQGLAEILVLSPLVLPPFVGALGFEAVLGRNGALNASLAQLGLITWAAPPDWLAQYRAVAICLIEALGLYPFLYLTCAAAIANLDPTMLEAARIAGASPLTRFRRIVLPLLRPGLFAGGVVVFVWSFTELGTPLMLGYDRHIAVQVWNGLSDAQMNRLPFAQVTVMLVLAAACYVLARTLFAGRDAAVLAKGQATSAPAALKGGRAWLAWAAILGVVALAAAPHLAVMALAFGRDWYRAVVPAGFTLDHVHAALAHAQVVPSIINSLVYAGLATAIALGLGTFVAWAAVRWRPPGWQVLDVLAMLPLAIPGIILAFGYRALPEGFAWLKWLDPVRDPTALLAIAYGVRRLPYVVRAASAGYAQLPVALEEAAAVSGAGPFTRIRRIVLPMLIASLAAGALLAFSSSMMEVADSLVLAERRETWPITKVIFGLIDILGPGPAIACAFATWAMLFLAASFAAAGALSGRGAGGLMRG